MRDITQEMIDLKEFGYTNPIPNPRSFGGPFCLMSPDGRLVWEDNFQAELEKILREEVN